MAHVAKVIPNFYRDSVALMQLSSRLSALPGVRQATAIMASANNLALLREAGLLASDVAAGPNDLLVALDGENEASLAAALAEAEQAFDNRPASDGGAELRREPPRSLEMGLDVMPAANLALISTPGDYAAAEALKALRLGLNVMLFSDNVPVEMRSPSSVTPGARSDGDGSGLRHRHHRWHSARLCECGATRRDRPCGRVGHRTAASKLSDRPAGRRHQPGDRYRRA